MLSSPKIRAYAELTPPPGISDRLSSPYPSSSRNIASLSRRKRLWSNNMPSAKALGKRRAIEVSSSSADEAEPVSNHSSSNHKRARPMSPVDPGNILESPPESPERPPAQEGVLPATAASSAPDRPLSSLLSLPATIIQANKPSAIQTEESELDEDDDDDEVIVVSNQRGSQSNVLSGPSAAATPQAVLNKSSNSNSNPPVYESAPFYRMTCPICMDPPKPMVVTNCGHAL